MRRYPLAKDTRRFDRSRAFTYLLPCGRQIIMDLALATLPVVTATVFATCAEAWVMADIVACVWISAARRRGADGVDPGTPNVRTTRNDGYIPYSRYVEYHVRHVSMG